MNNRLSIATLVLFMLAGCAGPKFMSQLDEEAAAVKERIAQAQEERKSYGKGSVVHDLVTLRIAIHEQTLAILEQRRAAGILSRRQRGGQSLPRDLRTGRGMQ